MKKRHENTKYLHVDQNKLVERGDLVFGKNPFIDTLIVEPEQGVVLGGILRVKVPAGGDVGVRVPAVQGNVAAHRHLGNLAAGYCGGRRETTLFENWS